MILDRSSLILSTMVLNTASDEVDTMAVNTSSSGFSIFLLLSFVFLILVPITFPSFSLALVTILCVFKNRISAIVSALLLEVINMDAYVLRNSVTLTLVL